MAATVWKGYLSFGLVSFPIRLAAAARAETVHFHLLHKKDLSRVREVMYCQTEDKPVDRADLVKGYEYEKDEYVVVEDEELKSMAPATASVMEILQFIRMEEVDPLLLETSYYVTPEEAGKKPYALLMQAMKETKYDAVAKVAMHNREHIVILRPTGSGIILHTMYFADELHRDNRTEIPSSVRFDKKELDLARKLINSLASPFRPEVYQDEYRRNVEKLIEQKRRGRKVTPIRQAKPSKVVDLMEALQRSLGESSARKPKAKKTVRKAGSRVA